MRDIRLENGKVSYKRYTYGFNWTVIASFKCNTGYKRVGPAAVHCISHDNIVEHYAGWSDRLPICESEWFILMLCETGTSCM